MIYRLVFKLLLVRLDPETAHRLATKTMRALMALPGGHRLLRALAGRPDPCLRVRAFGLSLPSPLGVAAGVDKEASWFEALGALGFGFVEVGTVTALAQEGNDRPRVFRIPSKRALLNRMGFPNPGADAIAARLSKQFADMRSSRRTDGLTRPTDRSSHRAEGTIVGVNVGKSKVTPLDRAAGDYRATVRTTAALCDYVAINVSSPNTPGLRDLQSPRALRELVAAVRAGLADAAVERPILVKLSPDLQDAQLDELAELALELGLDGIVAVNTTLDRRGVRDCPEIADVQGGGVSGAPLKRRAVEVLELLRARVGDRLVLVSVGGIETAEDAWERIGAGATLVQAYTGLVYGGPAWPRQVNRQLARRVRAAGASSIQELVGTGSG